MTDDELKSEIQRKLKALELTLGRMRSGHEQQKMIVRELLAAFASFGLSTAMIQRAERLLVEVKEAWESKKDGQ